MSSYFFSCFIVTPLGLGPRTPALKVWCSDLLSYGVIFVASTGFEPVISCVKGRRVNQLLHNAIRENDGIRTHDHQIHILALCQLSYILHVIFVGEGGLEPPVLDRNGFTVCHDSPTSPLSRIDSCLRRIMDSNHCAPFYRPNALAVRPLHQLG